MFSIKDENLPAKIILQPTHPTTPGKDHSLGMFHFIREPLDRYDDSNDDDLDFDTQDEDARRSFDKSNRLKRNSGTNPMLAPKRPCLSESPSGDASGLCFDASEKLTRGKQKIPIQFIEDRTKRYSTFSKRKTGLMKKAFELAELTGAEVLLLVASETNHVYTFATHRLKSIIELDCGKHLIQSCLSSNKASAGGLTESSKPDNMLPESYDHHVVPHLDAESDKDRGSVSSDECGVMTETVLGDVPVVQVDEVNPERSPHSADHLGINSCIPGSHEVTEIMAGCTPVDQPSVSPIVEAIPISSSLLEPATMITLPAQPNPSPPCLTTPCNPSPVILTGLFPPPSNVLLSTQMTTNQFLILSPPWNPIPVSLDGAACQTNSLTESTALGTINLANILNVNASQSMKSYSISIPMLNPVKIPDTVTSPSSSLTAVPTSLVNPATPSLTSVFPNQTLNKQ